MRPEALLRLENRQDFSSSTRWFSTDSCDSVDNAPQFLEPAPFNGEDGNEWEQDEMEVLRC
jgi:hypothetical protein